MRLPRTPPFAGQAGPLDKLLSVRQESQALAGPIANTQNTHFTVLFDFLAFFGLVSLLVILCTGWFSSRVQRPPTWFLYIFSWMFYSIGLLLMLGHQHASEPGFAICLTQAMTLYANPVFVSTSTMSFLIKVLLDTRYKLKGKSTSTRQMTALLAVPIISWIAILLEVLIFGLKNRSAVQREASGMFCHITSPLPEQISGSIVMALIITSLPINFAIALTILRNKHSWSTLFGKEYTPTLVLRVVLFDATPLLGLALDVAEYIPPKFENLPALNAMLALLPALAGIAFMSQRDILRAWMFWLPPEKPKAVEFMPH
ncbi:hypothetical protein GALMADRAFT_225810 [Galerina marginata CBS 339.88]|uniref:G-protein coupled receptors family 1 profile domain-containing protein n=1 Tax=Galerina marginata (strain CBS 339.88) TaxID=685588 RepID=A0A067SYV2_GALM3|nr:hypothetical protein GALMADRAFT_225810 [Galerina marginata CBS 339.88]